MKNLIGVVLLVLVFGLNAFCQVDTARITILGTKNHEKAFKMKSSKQGGYALIGTSENTSEKRGDILLLKIDSNLKKEWSYLIGSNETEFGVDFIENSDGSFYVLGNTNNGGFGGYDYYILKVDSQNIIWEIALGGENWDLAKSMTQFTNGDILIVGESYSSKEYFSCCRAFRISENGEIVWEKEICRDRSLLINKVLIDSINNIYLCGNFISDSLTEQAVLYKLNQNFDSIWVKEFGGVLNDNFNTMMFWDDTTIICGGYSESLGSNTKDYYFIKVDTTGNLIWQRVPLVYIEAEEFVTDIKRKNSNIIFTGTNNSIGSGKEDIQLIELDFYGDLIDGYNYGWSNSEYSASVIVLDSGYLVQGYTDSYEYFHQNQIHTIGFGGYDIIIIKASNDYSKNWFTIEKVEILSDTTFTKTKELNFHDLTRVSVYPNPFNGAIYFSNYEQIQSINVFNIIGHYVVSASLNSDAYISTIDWKNGIYLVKIQLLSGEEMTYKLIKN
jgi:hypothetical protein